jgi:predicted amidohydrolase
VVIARACRAYVAFASFAGPTGGGYAATAGTSAVWSPEGDVLDRARPDVGEYARSRLPQPRREVTFSAGGGSMPSA